MHKNHGSKTLYTRPMESGAFGKKNETKRKQNRREILNIHNIEIHYQGNDEFIRNLLSSQSTFGQNQSYTIPQNTYIGKLDYQICSCIYDSPWRRQWPSAQAQCPRSPVTISFRRHPPSQSRTAAPTCNKTWATQWKRGGTRTPWATAFSSVSRNRVELAQFGLCLLLLRRPHSLRRPTATSHVSPIHLLSLLASSRQEECWHDGPNRENASKSPLVWIVVMVRVELFGVASAGYAGFTW